MGITEAGCTMLRESIPFKLQFNISQHFAIYPTEYPC